MAARHRKCKNPEKQKYPNEAAARAALKNGHWKGLRLPVRTYRCRDHYHLTGNAR